MFVNIPFNSSLAMAVRVADVGVVRNALGLDLVGLVLSLDDEADREILVGLTIGDETWTLMTAGSD